MDIKYVKGAVAGAYIAVAINVAAAHVLACVAPFEAFCIGGAVMAVAGMLLLAFTVASDTASDRAAIAEADRINKLWDKAHPKAVQLRQVETAV